MRALLVLSALAIFTISVAQTSPEAAFIASYSRAHDSRDIAALKELQFLERVPAGDNSVSTPAQFNFAEPIKSIRIVPATKWPPPDFCCDPATLFVREGIKYELNLPVVALLQVEYVPGKNSSGSKSETPLGFKDGHYRIISLVRSYPEDLTRP
jgi:hypothetical protein